MTQELAATIRKTTEVLFVPPTQRHHVSPLACPQLLFTRESEPCSEHARRIFPVSLARHDFVLVADVLLQLPLRRRDGRRLLGLAGEHRRGEQEQGDRDSHSPNMATTGAHWQAKGLRTEGRGSRSVPGPAPLAGAPTWQHRHSKPVCELDQLPSTEALINPESVHDLCVLRSPSLEDRNQIRVPFRPGSTPAVSVSRSHLGDPELPGASVWPETSTDANLIKTVHSGHTVEGVVKPQALDARAAARLPKDRCVGHPSVSASRRCPVCKGTTPRAFGPNESIRVHVDPAPTQCIPEFSRKCARVLALRNCQAHQFFDVTKIGAPRVARGFDFALEPGHALGCSCLGAPQPFLPHHDFVKPADAHIQSNAVASVLNADDPTGPNPERDSGARVILLKRVQIDND